MAGSKSKNSEKRLREILDSLTRLHVQFSPKDHPGPIFERMLSLLLEISASEYGFIGEIMVRETGEKYLRTFALTNIAWDDATRKFYEENAPQGLEFTNLNTLFGHTIQTGEIVCTNMPKKHPKSAGIPNGHPALNSYLGLPIFSGDRMIGMAGLANRPNGFDSEVVNELEPLLKTCGGFISQLIAERERDVALSLLREKERKLKAVLSNVFDPLFILNQQGLVQDINTAAYKAFGYEPGEISVSDLSKLVPEAHAIILDLIDATSSSSARNTVLLKPTQIKGRYKDGTMFDVEMAITRSGESSSDNIIVVMRDITDRLRLDRMKDEFISMASHELRTPVTAVKGALDLVAGLDSIDPTRSKDLVDIARRNADRLGLLLNDILDISKIESGKMPLVLTTVFLPDLIKLVISEMYPYGMKLKVNFVTTEDLPPIYVKGDEARLVQVLSNLLSNAAKFSEPNSDVVVNLEQVGKQACISIQDFGRGIPESFKNKMFDKFTQADASNTRDKSGTGLGLSIVHSLVRLHGGTITFESAEGEGTIFRIYLDICDKQ